MATVPSQPIQQLPRYVLLDCDVVVWLQHLPGMTCYLVRIKFTNEFIGMVYPTKTGYRLQHGTRPYLSLKTALSMMLLNYYVTMIPPTDINKFVR